MNLVVAINPLLGEMLMAFRLNQVELNTDTIALVANGLNIDQVRFKHRYNRNQTD